MDIKISQMKKSVELKKEKKDYGNYNPTDGEDI